MQDKSSASFQLVLGTGAFSLCFAVFGSMSAMMPIISKHMALTPVQKSIAIAIPVLLGSLGRIPLGILTDRFGGRIAKAQFWSPKPATQRPIRSRQVLRCPAPPHLHNGDSVPLFCQARRADTAAEPRSNDDEVEVVLRSVTWHRDSLS